ncbi:MAG TPA: thiamine-phosphate kinase [Thermoanaerobaculia bacterium]|nr:thiamine-phosphate kinase [Thermoanaerobaculia bacterium]
MTPSRGEDALLTWLRERLGDGNLLGDDGALLPESPGGGVRVATVDSQIAGVHHPADLNPALVARRLLAVNLSDLAAMGADPELALLALSAPPGFDHRRFLIAFIAASAEAGVSLAGGDLATCPTTVATLTLLGRVPPGRAALRRGAGRPGDLVWLAGPLGASAAGRLLLARGARVTLRGAPERAPQLAYELPENLIPGLAGTARRALRRHLLPEPQLALGVSLSELAASAARVAAIDLSDGLALDLARLCREGGCGAEVTADLLPIAGEVDTLAAWLAEDPRRLALSGGEDYVLLFTLPPGVAPPAGFACTRIGRLTEDPALVLVTPAGPVALEPAGWDHLAP